MAPDTANPDYNPDYEVTLVLPDVCEPADYESTPTPEDAVQAFIGAVQSQPSLYVYEVYDFTSKRRWHVDLAEGITREVTPK